MEFNGGIAGNQAITMSNASGANATYSLGGTLVASSINITGGASGTNALSVNTGDNQNWTITGANAGSLSGLSQVGSFNYNNVGSITGGSGSNTLTADNAASATWNLAGSNAGSSVTNLSNGFDNIQNLVGSSVGNTFNFADNAAISGSVTGSATSGNDTFNFTAYTTGVTVLLNSSTIFAGNIQTVNNINVVGSYSNIANMQGNNTYAANNTILIPVNVPATVTIVDPTANTGYINDPLTFSGFSVANATPPPTPAPSSSSNLNVAAIVQQPIINGNSNVNSNTSSTPAWVLADTSLSNNLDMVVQDVANSYNIDLNKVKINPYCYAASN